MQAAVTRSYRDSDGPARIRVLQLGKDSTNLLNLFLRGVQPTIDHAKDIDKLKQDAAVIANMKMSDPRLRGLLEQSLETIKTCISFCHRAKVAV